MSRSGKIIQIEDSFELSEILGIGKMPRTGNNGRPRQLQADKLSESKIERSKWGLKYWLTPHKSSRKLIIITPFLPFSP